MKPNSHTPLPKTQDYSRVEMRSEMERTWQLSPALQPEAKEVVHHFPCSCPDCFSFRDW